MSTELKPTTHLRSEYLPAGLAICIYTAVVLKSAWLCDDAYITFRTVDNFVHGHGLTWNVAERVQSYTHPLWMFLLAAIYCVTHEIHYMSILLGVVFSVAAVLFLAGRAAVGAFSATIAVTALLLSKAFVDYSTSGLENPLTHLLLVLFLVAYLARPPDRKTLFWLSLLAALLAFNRLDAILLVLPVLCVAFYHVRGVRALGVVVAGFTPLIAWGLFALFYYGSFFPNTASAKLNTGLATSSLIGQGLFYLLATLKLDPLTLCVTCVGLATPLITRQYRHLPVTIGALLYLAYVIRIGGDSMLGRFLTPPLLIAVVLLARATITTRTGAVLLVLIIILGVVPDRSPLTSDEDYGFNMEYIERGVGDERGFYYWSTGLLLARNKTLPDHPWADGGRAARESGGPVVTNAIGMFGFCAGPGVHVVDELGLADPLLARLRPDVANGWRIGHLYRRIPVGYLETLQSEENLLGDPQLAEYYETLRLVTRGRLWDPQRWLAIVKLNLGVYDNLLTAAQP